MANVEDDVARHYTTGAIIDRLMAGLEAQGVKIADAKPEDLKPVDEFHTGGMEATIALLDQLDITRDTDVLDIGCGIGGTARAVAGRHGCHVTGIDLTEAFVDAAHTLTNMAGLGDRTDFKHGSALALPVGDAGFDIAFLLHVGMNIANKPGLFAEARRALRHGATFAVFEVMKRGPDPLEFPLPWSSVPETSFVDPPETYRAAAEAAGFELVSERDRSDFASDYFARVIAMIAERGGPPLLGIHLLMGDTAPQKIANYVTCLESGRIAPTEMIFRISV
jgi:ubiquinone/menaquinone biosynthesis C-methylase UbiE